MAAVGSSPEERRLDGDKAQRIVAAMRASVGSRGAAGSTFDVVAREAGVSRGLLHYYFGTKERLMVEVVRADAAAREAVLRAELRDATTVEEIVDSLAGGLEAFVSGDPGAHSVLYEMLSAARHSEEIRLEMAELYRRWRGHMAAALEEKQRAGVVTLQADADTVAAMLFALGDGLGVQMIADPQWASGMPVELAKATARRLLGAAG